MLRMILILLFSLPSMAIANTVVCKANVPTCESLSPEGRSFF
jgi:hypothetical protein